ncbi:hypothetical protein TVAGG3_0853550 [Trichomonas vaginalis G3]|uniref:hypothetical protein n=1 Tax=Trichomonas vaginalis (strain ATCC PRA-98 / G3) TaxID=412133 RepID=UPI0021E55267|nr:hypothetical protein TVAGG3_0853550 [Trichomonas vaginalis G3]KAI5500174.1 hypothetical protein TVAGG3_0853550 [Trichomonas vaginalis G3]
MTKMKYVDEFGDNRTKWFEYYTTTQFEFDFSRIQRSNHSYHCSLPFRTTTRPRRWRCVTVVMKLPEQFGKKKSLMPNSFQDISFSNARSLFVFLELSSLSGSELKERYNVSFNYTLYNVFRPRRRLLPEAMEEEEEEGNTRLYPRRSSEFTPEGLTIFRIKNFIYTKTSSGLEAQRAWKPHLPDLNIEDIHIVYLFCKRIYRTF